MDFKVENNVPVPKKRQYKVRRNYPFDIMEIGDSFFVPVPEDKKLTSMQCSVATSARLYCNYHKLKMKFKTKAEANGFRVWRIK